jgi:hypothetical protein
MFALMTLWFGQYAGIAPEGGYFYLCPSCYQRFISPHAREIAHRLAEHHPTIRRASSQPKRPGDVAPPGGPDAFPPDEAPPEAPLG